MNWDDRQCSIARLPDPGSGAVTKVVSPGKARHQRLVMSEVLRPNDVVGLEEIKT